MHVEVTRNVPGIITVIVGDAVVRDMNCWLRQVSITRVRADSF